MNTTQKLVLASALAISLTGCTKMTASQLALSSVAQGNIDKSSRPACEIQQTEYSLDAKLVSFELTDSAGVNAGFSILTGFLKLLSLDFQATSGTLTVGLTLTEPLSPSLQLVNVLGGGTAFQFNAAVDAGFQNIGAGFNYTHSTPLASLAKGSLDDGFTNLTTTMDSKQAEWKTQVLAIPNENQFVIPAGSFANVKKGDLFVVRNVNHVWDGTPCQSKYLMGVESSELPVIARADQIEANASLLTVVCDAKTPCSTQKIVIGANVHISQLTDANRTLARLVRINSVTGGTIQYEQSKTVDISPYLKDIINSVAGSYNFLVYAQ